MLPMKSFLNVWRGAIAPRAVPTTKFAVIFTYSSSHTFLHSVFHSLSLFSPSTRSSPSQFAGVSYYTNVLISVSSTLNGSKSQSCNHQWKCFPLKRAVGVLHIVLTAPPRAGMRLADALVIQFNLAAYWMMLCIPNFMSTG